MSMKVVVFSILLVFMAFFLVQNTQIVQIKFLIWSIEASRVLIYLSIFLLGVATGWLGNSLRRWYKLHR